MRIPWILSPLPADVSWGTPFSSVLVLLECFFFNLQRCPQLSKVWGTSEAVTLSFKKTEVSIFKHTWGNSANADIFILFWMISFHCPANRQWATYIAISRIKLDYVNNFMPAFQLKSFLLIPHPTPGSIMGLTRTQHNFPRIIPLGQNHSSHCLRVILQVLGYPRRAYRYSYNEPASSFPGGIGIGFSSRL